MKQVMIFLVGVVMLGCSTETGTLDPYDEDADASVEVDIPDVKEEDGGGVQDDDDDNDDNDDNDVVDDDDDDNNDTDKVCEPYEKQCASDVVMRCDEFGNDWAIYEECKEDEECIDGECVPLAGADVDDDDDDDDNDVTDDDDNNDDAVDDDDNNDDVDDDDDLSSDCKVDSHCEYGYECVSGKCVTIEDDDDDNDTDDDDDDDKCITSSDCTDPNKSVCDAFGTRKCVQCLGDLDCDPGECCDINTNTCGSCGDDDDDVVDDDDTCTPDCTDKECGEDGCDGSCGVCNNPPNDTWCYDEIILTKYIDADGVCNSGVCIYKTYNTDCENGCEDGKCLDCVPDCTDKECGSDGCGGSCGDCIGCNGIDNMLCNNGICQQYPCPDCIDKECGPDGHGGSCGDCGDFGTCKVSGICHCYYEECASECCPQISKCGESGNCCVPEEVGFYNFWSDLGHGYLSGLFVDGRYAYLAMGYDGLLIVNLSNPRKPQQVGSYKSSGYITDVHVVGNYAYISERYGHSFQVIDISNKRTPLLAGSYEGQCAGMGVFVSNNRAYVDSVDNDGGITDIFDVSDPENPEHLSGDLPGNAQVFVTGDYIYISHNILLIYDISDPENVIYKGQNDEPTEAQGIFIENNFAYIADGSNGLRIFDISDKENPELLGTLKLDGSAIDVHVKNGFAYVATVGSDGLRVIDVRDAINPALVGAITCGGQSGTYYSAKTVHLEGNYVYMPCSHEIQIIDISSCK